MELYNLDFGQAEGQQRLSRLSKRRERRSERRRKRRVRILILLLVPLIMLVTAGGSYIYGTKKIFGKYEGIRIVTIEKEGMQMRELARMFLPDLSESFGTRLIKAANGYTDDDPWFLEGQKVRIPVNRNGPKLEDGMLRPE